MGTRQRSRWCLGLLLAVFTVGCERSADAPESPSGTGATSSGDAGASAKCADLKRVATACYDNYCASDGGSTPFCGCWKAGRDISTGNCKCIDRDLDVICQRINLDAFQTAHYDCPRALDGVGSVCLAPHDAGTDH